MCPISMVIMYDQEVLKTGKAREYLSQANAAAKILGVQPRHIESIIAGYDGLDISPEDSRPWFELGQILAAKYKDKIKV